MQHSEASFWLEPENGADLNVYLGMVGLIILVVG